jgi:hypothetical protein
MGVLRRLLWMAFLCMVAGFCLLMAIALLVGLVLAMYWETRVIALGVLAAVFTAGGAVAILFVRARARASNQVAALAGAVEIVYWSVRVLGLLARR